MAVAIDGEIFQDAYLVPLNPDSEIYHPQNRRRLSRATICAAEFGRTIGQRAEKE